MYHSQVGMFAIPHLNRKNLKRLHDMAFGIPRIDDDVYKCEPIPDKLFTNARGEAPGWVLSQGARVIMSAWPADFPCYMTPLPTLPSNDIDKFTKESTRLPIPEGCFITDLANHAVATSFKEDKTSGQGRLGRAGCKQGRRSSRRKTLRHRSGVRGGGGLN